MPKSLSPTDAELTLIDNAATGNEADLSALTDDDDKTISASVIYALATETKKDDWPVHAKGVKLRGAVISGELDFESAKTRTGQRPRSSGWTRMLFIALRQVMPQKIRATDAAS